ncbi:MAG: neutral/alkaline non-lysosomal ceramidase N-terminal domain-containing protein [Chloroflexota bacterium]|nr:neutral/alkaline non-lysosomal ceramidase N-terminal domain-containing protein [Chloroflexota bacterium]
MNTPSSAQQRHPMLQAGAATTTFPVDAGTPMAGYVARDGVATGTLDPLTLSALVLADEVESCVVIAADVVGVDAELLAELRVRLPWSPTALIVCASHTHSGPRGIATEMQAVEPDPGDRAMRERFVTTCADLIAQATATLAPVTLHLGREPVLRVSANRNDPATPIDSAVTTLEMRLESGSPVALLVHFACHPTILGASNTLLSADLFGAIRASLADLARHAFQTPILCLNGAAADISTRFTRQGQDAREVTRLGRQVAAAAAKAIAAATPLAGELRTTQRSIALPPRPRVPAKAAHDLAQADRDLTAAITASDAERRIAITRREGAMLAAQRARPSRETIAIPISGLAVDRLAIVSIPGELSSSLGRRIERASPFPSTIVAGYTNGYVGYIVDAADYDVPTYESLASPFDASAGAEIVDATVALLRQLHASAEAKESRREPMQKPIGQPS